ncbi:MAG: family 16 glycoside hydrolase [Bacteroidales bacterium]
MNRLRTLLTLAAVMLFHAVTSSQDVRTLETRVADLLGRLPAESRELASNLMEEMYALGDAGTDIICGQVIPAGTGDDTRARYAIASLTAHISGDSDEVRKRGWERQCIKFMKAANDSEVRAFFMRQLNLIGSDTAVEALKDYAGSDQACDDAVMVLQSVGSEAALDLLSAVLRKGTSPCAAQIMVALAEHGYAGAIDSYVYWNGKGTPPERAAALYALASTGDAGAGQILMQAAAEASYQWNPVGAVNSLLLYARNIGLAGDTREMEKITDLVISKSNTPATAGQRLAAMSVITEVKGIGALNMLLEAADDPDVAIRGGALRLAASMPGSDVTKKWINRYSKVRPEAKPEILLMLGERGDELAVPLMMKALNDPSQEIAGEAVTALARLRGKRAVDPLLSWILKTDSEEGHRTAANALTTILDSTTVARVAESLPALKGHSTVTLIWLLSWSGDSNYFKTVYPYTGSEDMAVRAAALTSLASLASWDDQPQIISLLEKTSERAEIPVLQGALLSAAMRGDDPAARSELILAALDKSSDKLRLIPLLARTGGAEALKRVAYEFENGDAGTRDVCFDALAHWSDHSALPALRTICASGNKTFGMPAFDAYLRMVSLSPLTPERKLLLIKDIAPHAMAPGAMSDMISLASSLKIRQAGFFISGYLSDPSDEVRKAAEEAIASMNLSAGEDFEPMFNGKDLTGWKGLVGNPLTRAAMKPKELAAKQKEADLKMLTNWSVRDGMIWFSGNGDNLCSVRDYGDFEMYVDWRITKDGDSGIYLRGTPQVQIWDTSRTDAGAQVGSGGLYNNQKNPSAPLKVADNPVGEWNTFRIMMTGDRVSVWLNGEPVTDDVIMENYWDRTIPIFERGAVELQAHGTDLNFRDIYIREIKSAEYKLTDKEKEAGFVSVFNGRNLDGWAGNKTSYVVEDGMIVIKPGDGSGGNLYTEKEYSDFVFRFEFQLTPGANNGLGIRTPMEGDAAYVGMELQILDNTASIFADLEPYQYHGSVYGVIPARRGFLRPVGEWNYQEVTAQGTGIKVVLNGTVIVDGDIAEASANGTLDGKDHPGLKNSRGHIGFLGHGSLVRFRNIRIKEL